MVGIVCGKGRVRKKFMGRESQSLGVGLAKGKGEVCITGVILLQL